MIMGDILFEKRFGSRGPAAGRLPQSCSRKSPYTASGPVQMRCDIGELLRKKHTATTVLSARASIA